MQYSAFALFFVVSFYSVGATAQLAGDTNYFCTVESSGGISYDSVTKQWRGTSFRPNGKFVLKLKFVRARTVRNNFLKTDEPVKDFEIYITESGHNFGQPCLSFSNEDRKTLTIYEEHLAVRCDASLSTYVFNFKTNRFIEAYLVGYVAGEENNSNTPSVSGGTCTKIN